MYLGYTLIKWTVRISINKISYAIHKETLSIFLQEVSIRYSFHNFSCCYYHKQDMFGFSFNTNKSYNHTNNILTQQHIILLLKEVSLHNYLMHLRIDDK